MPQPILLDLSTSSEVHKLVVFMQDRPKGALITEISKGTGLSDNQIRHYCRTLNAWFTNVTGKRRGEFIKLNYRPTDPNIVVTVAQPGNGTSPATGTAQTKSVPTNVIATPNSTGQTDIIWAPSPPIPDVNEKYSFFIKPSYYDRLRSKMMAHGKSIRIKGPPGIGKSSAVEYLAAKEVIPLVNIGAESGLRGRQLIGAMSDLHRFEVAEFATAVVKGWWAKIDEVNGADPDAIMFLNSITAPPFTITINGRTYPVHRDFRLVVTYNPGLVGTKPLPDSLKDRLYPFNVRFPDKGQLTRMLKSNEVDVDKEPVQKMIDFAMAVAKERAANKFRFDITMRRLLDAYSDMQDGFSVHDSLYNACVDGIDNSVDALAVEALLPAK